MLRFAQYKNDNDPLGHDLFFMSWDGRFSFYLRSNSTEIGSITLDFISSYPLEYKVIWGK